MKIKGCIPLILVLVALAIIYPLASYACDQELAEESKLSGLDLWLERLEDGWIPLSLLEDEDLS